MREHFNWLINKKEDYRPLLDEEYYEKFGIVKNSVNGKYEVKNKKILEKAYTKAWENRDFEIDKFWTRAAYFWGFIVLIFGGYITILTNEHTDKAVKMHLDLYLVSLGLLFSVTWYLVILGSKSWQKNWEAHIDYLEDFVSGPIYKTIFYSGNKFYSVSKLNEIMALAVLFVWGGLYIQYLEEHYFLLTAGKIDIIATISVFLTFLFIIILRWGYSSGSYRSKKERFINRWD